ncbi:MAG: zinc-ribbon domain-containing protein [Promethearchaeota archaeon]
MPIVCPSCGQTVKDTAVFCKFCGYRLSAAPSATRIQPRADAKAATRKSEQIAEVPAEILAQLEAKAQLMELESEEQEVLGELERLDAELERGDRSIAELEKEIKPLQKRIKTLKTKEKNLQAKVTGFTFEKAGKERLLWADRLEKLEGLKESGKVRKSVYSRLQREYDASRSESESKYQGQILQAREWLALLKAQYTAARDELSLLEARHSVGEVKDADFESRREKLENRSKILGRQVEILESILRDV